MFTVIHRRVGIILSGQALSRTKKFGRIHDRLFLCLCLGDESSEDFIF